jgi:hypothetical protein
MRWRWSASSAILIAALLASPARACPLCDSGTGERVRAGIFGADFGYHLLATLLPFPIFLGIVALIHHGPLRTGRTTRPEAGDAPVHLPTTIEEPPWTTDRINGR